MADKLLNLKEVSKVFASGTVGLDAISMDAAEGEFISLLGPSGCGKTTTLRIIAGFEHPTSGRVLLDGEDIVALPPYRRPVNTVFQDYALFPHMTVADNVGFGPSLRGVSSSEIRRKVGDALELVGLAEKLNEPVQSLSGGQRQRVALARAIVCEPRVLLLDEPLSALDAHLREQMQVELKRLQRELGTTFIMVTHDQTEALSISDRIVVMNRGKIDQIASPASLYDHPATRFVASFIGTMNLLEADLVSSDNEGIHFSAGDLHLTTLNEDSPWTGRGGRVTLGIRPEEFVLSGDFQPGATAGAIRSAVFHGHSMRVQVETKGGRALTVDVPRNRSEISYNSGEPVFVTLRPGAKCAVLPV